MLQAFGCGVKLLHDVVFPHLPGLRTKWLEIGLVMIVAGQPVVVAQPDVE